MPESIRDKDITRLLDSISFPNERRRAVRRDAADRKKGFVLGHVTQTMQNQAHLSVMSKRNPELCKIILNAWARQRWPRFRYTCIQVNEGTSALHVDRMNCGPSVIKALGQFKGGRLWSYDTPKKFIDVKRGRGYKMDGNIPHITEPAQGKRCSFVFFTPCPRRENPTPTADRVLYRRLGFPTRSCPYTCTKTQADKLPEASKILQTLHGFSRRYIGDYSNKTIKRR